MAVCVCVHDDVDDTGSVQRDDNFGHENICIGSYPRCYGLVHLIYASRPVRPPSHDDEAVESGQLVKIMMVEKRFTGSGSGARELDVLEQMLAKGDHPGRVVCGMVPLGFGHIDAVEQLARVVFPPDVDVDSPPSPQRQRSKNDVRVSVSHHVHALWNITSTISVFSLDLSDQRACAGDCVLFHANISPRCLHTRKDQ